MVTSVCLVLSEWCTENESPESTCEQIEPCGVFDIRKDDSGFTGKKKLKSRRTQKFHEKFVNDGLEGCRLFCPVPISGVKCLLQFSQGSPIPTQSPFPRSLTVKEPGR